jgi:serine/threonine protein kinase
VLAGLDFIHSKGYFHRDIKPENLLLRGDTCKLGDFGLAKDTFSTAPCTEYVSTRWYRAPEVLLRDPQYGPPIDIFAVGCVMMELYSHIPLFPGSNEVDQIHKIMNLLGVPTIDSWPEGMHLARKMKFQLESSQQRGGSPGNTVQKELQKIAPRASTKAIQLISNTLQLDPNRRPCASNVLQYDYFTSTSKRKEIEQHHNLEKFRKEGIQNPYKLQSLSATTGGATGNQQYKQNNFDFLSDGKSLKEVTQSKAGDVYQAGGISLFHSDSRLHQSHFSGVKSVNNVRENTDKFEDEPFLHDSAVKRLDEQTDVYVLADRKYDKHAQEGNTRSSRKLNELLKTGWIQRPKHMSITPRSRQNSPGAFHEKENLSMSID